MTNILSNRRFWPLFLTQFFGAFNDNVFKNALVILITFKAYSLGVLSPKLMVALCGGLFILPFFLFSAIAGKIADKYSKSKLTFWIKVWEIMVMMVGATGFLMESVPLLLVTLFFMGLQSTFFGPIKYSILPELLHPNDLVTGNAYVEMGTFIAILLGTIFGGVIIAIPGTGNYIAAVSVILFAIVGMLASLKIVELERAAPDTELTINIMKPTWEILKLTRKNRYLFLGVMGISWFWFIGAVLISVLPPYGKEFFNGDESLVTLFLAAFSVGIGVGSIICERLSGKKLELGLVPIGSLGMTIFALDLYFVGRPSVYAVLSNVGISTFFAHSVGYRIFFDLVFISVFGGFFIVPLYTLLQVKSEPSERAQVIAANNIVNSLFMVTAAVMLMVVFSFGFTIADVFLILAVLNLVVAVYLYFRIPEFLYRFFAWCMARLLYRLRTEGREHIPHHGGAVLICNHMSFVDWLLIMAISPRPIRFVMHKDFFGIPLLSGLFRRARIIAIAHPNEDREVFLRSFDLIEQELEEGELVCIFPEGEITRSGELGAFKRGIEKIIGQSSVPVIPMAISGMWGSFFSRKYGRALSRPFARFHSKVFIRVGNPVAPENATADALRESVKNLWAGN